MQEEIDQFTTSITIHADNAAVWHALTDPELMKQRLGDPEMEIEVLTNWLPGETVIISGNHNEPFENRGVVLTNDLVNVLIYTNLGSVSRSADVPQNYSVFLFFTFIAKSGNNTNAQNQTFRNGEHAETPHFLLAHDTCSHQKFAGANSGLNFLKRNYLRMALSLCISLGKVQISFFLSAIYKLEYSICLFDAAQVVVSVVGYFHYQQFVYDCL